MRLTPADCAFEAFGGPVQTARILGISAGTVTRWQRGWYSGDTERQRTSRTRGMVPIHHIQSLLTAAQTIGKTLTLEHLVFGRDPLTEGVVIVKNGRKMEVRMHDHMDYMVSSLSMGGG